MIKTIYLDMDGVLTNFMDHALALHGTSTAALNEKWPLGHYNVHEAVGISEDAFWGKIDGEAGFWESLPFYPWADRIYSKALEAATHVVILTAPSMGLNSAAGKLACLQKWKGRHFREWMLVPAKHKHRVAKPGTLLIDDSDRNIADFTKAGGQAILFPQRWNANHAWASDPIEHVLDLLSQVPQ